MMRKKLLGLLLGLLVSLGGCSAMEAGRGGAKAWAVWGEARSILGLCGDTPPPWVPEPPREDSGDSIDAGADASDASSGAPSPGAPDDASASASASSSPSADR